MELDMHLLRTALQDYVEADELKLRHNKRLVNMFVAVWMAACRELALTSTDVEIYAAKCTDEAYVLSNQDIQNLLCLLRLDDDVDQLLEVLDIRLARQAKQWPIVVHINAHWDTVQAVRLIIVPVSN